MFFSVVSHTVCTVSLSKKMIWVLVLIVQHASPFLLCAASVSGGGDVNNNSSGNSNCRHAISLTPQIEVDTMSYTCATHGACANNKEVVMKRVAHA